MFIEEYPGAVPVELCERIIARFEADPARKPSDIYVGGQLTNAQMRTGTSLECNLTGDWKALIDPVIPVLQKVLLDYARKYPALDRLIGTEGLHCTSPIIERVDPGQGFDWHYDQTARSWERVVTSLLYLRTVREGGATEFPAQGHNVRPEAGKIALFPAGWTHIHRGAPPVSEPKYVMNSFWIYDRSRSPTP